MIADNYASTNRTISSSKYIAQASTKDTKAEAKYAANKDNVKTTTDFQTENWGGQSEKISYSENYISYNLSNVVDEIISEVTAWKETYGETGSILHIRRLRIILNENDKYFMKKPETRILSSILKLIFSERNWLKISNGQLNQIIDAIKQFKVNQLDQKKLKIFLNQVFRANIEIL